jgi:hydrogenase nickel incorporation protein HypA/HybF
MHELAICNALIEQVKNLAIAHKASGIACIRVAIGPLAGVEPQLLEQAFTVARNGSLAAQATLEITSLPIQVQCQRCEQITKAQPANLTCQYCGDWHTQLISGDELLLSQVELLLP